MQQFGEQIEGVTQEKQIFLRMQRPSTKYRKEPFKYMLTYERIQYCEKCVFSEHMPDRRE